MKKGSFALRLFLYASLVSLVWLGSYVIFSELFAVKETAPDKPQAQVTKAPELPVPVSSQWSVLAVVNEESEVTAFLFRYADFSADAVAPSSQGIGNHVLHRLPVDGAGCHHRSNVQPKSTSNAATAIDTSDTENRSL